MEDSAKTALIVIAVALLVILALPILWGSVMMAGMMGSGFAWSGGWGLGLLGAGSMVLFWVAVIVGIVLLVRWFVSTGQAGQVIPREESALEILKQRYARGEITREEYEEMRRTIQGA